VRDCRIEEQLCRRRISELTDACTSITAAWNAAPGGSGANIHKDAALVSLADQQAKLIRLLLDCQKQSQAVEDFINQLENQTYRAVLHLRYVALRSWPGVEEGLQECGLYYSMRQIYRIHGSALQEARRLWAEQHTGEEQDT
jgi:hypothetical protein